MSKKVLSVLALEDKNKKLRQKQRAMVNKMKNDEKKNNRNIALSCGPALFEAAEEIGLEATLPNLLGCLLYVSKLKEGCDAQKRSDLEKEFRDLYDAYVARSKAKEQAELAALDAEAELEKTAPEAGSVLSQD